MSDLTELDRLVSLVVPSNLLLARHAILSSLELQRVFDRAAIEGWNVERLSTALGEGLSQLLGDEIGAETARYLAEEFEARDKTQTLLVSLETGRAVAQVPSDAFYQPDPVAREDTDKLATPLIRLKPEIEAGIIQHHNERGVEDNLAIKLQARARSTELQRAEGDARLRIATRSGRKGLAAQLFQELPTLLLDHRGASGRLLSRCRVNEEVPSGHSLTRDLVLFAHVSVLVADPLAMNFRHDAYGSARERIRAEWTRALAKVIARQAHLQGQAAHVGTRTELGSGLLIAEPNVIKATRHPDKFLVPDAPAAILRGDIYLTLEVDHQLEAYETEARWKLDASVSVGLHFAPESVCPLIFTDAVETSQTVEVIRRQVSS